MKVLDDGFEIHCCDHVLHGIPRIYLGWRIHIIGGETVAQNHVILTDHNNTRCLRYQQMRRWGAGCILCQYYRQMSQQNTPKTSAKDCFGTAGVRKRGTAWDAPGTKGWDQYDSVETDRWTIFDLLVGNLLTRGWFRRRQNHTSLLLYILIWVIVRGWDTDLTSLSIWGTFHRQIQWQVH